LPIGDPDKIPIARDHLIVVASEVVKRGWIFWHSGSFLIEKGQLFSISNKFNIANNFSGTFAKVSWIGEDPEKFHRSPNRSGRRFSSDPRLALPSIQISVMFFYILMPSIKAIRPDWPGVCNNSVLLLVKVFHPRS
jgi:hypothetical protein